MKTIYKIYPLTVALAVAFSSCELNEDLESVYTTHNAYVTEKNAQEGVNGIYRYLKGANHPATFYLNDLCTDACYKSGSDFEIFNDNNLGGSVELARAYNGNWQMIGCANVAIDNITLMDDEKFKPVEKKEELLAEAHFMRAFAFYQLTNIFYEVPLITNGYYDAAANPTLATIDELDAQIEKDLLIALNTLPLQWDASKYEGSEGRPTKGATYGYLMRLYMRKAGRLSEEGKDAAAAWQAALNYADQVIATGKYSLLAKPEDPFNPRTYEARNNAEIIYAVRSTDKSPSGSYDLALYFTPWRYNMGWDIFSVPLELYWKFDKDDLRLKNLLVGEYPDVYDKAGIKYQAPTLAQVGSLDNDKSNPKVKELGQVYTNKYFYEKSGTYDYNTPNNLPLLRYADVLLCKAEILNELNGVNQTSIDLINQIRERAFGNSNHNYTLTSFTTKEALRSALCDERLFELNNEGVRRIDLIRMGLWKDRLDSYMEAIKEKTEKQEQNRGLTKGFLSAQWSVYPKFSSNPLKKYDKRRYFPIPKVYTSKFPSLENNRSFKEQ